MDDTISRLEVIQIIEKMRARIGHNLERSVGRAMIEILDEVGEDVEKLPSALGTNSAEVGTDLISKKAVLVAVKDALMAWSYMPEWRDEKILKAIADLPSAQPEPSQVARDIARIVGNEQDMRVIAQPERIKGRWEQDGHHIRCDQCGMYMCDTDREGDRIPTEFCPHCGADMRGEQK